MALIDKWIEANDWYQKAVEDYKRAVDEHNRDHGLGPCGGECIQKAKDSLAGAKRAIDETLREYVRDELPKS